MLSHLLSFVVMGIVQLALTVYGEYLAVKSLPPGEKRRPHLLGIGRLGCLAVALTVWIEPAILDSSGSIRVKKNSVQLIIWAALATTFDQTPLLHSCLRHRSCDAEEFLPRGCKTETPRECPSELLCGGSNLPTLGEVVTQSVTQFLTFARASVPSKLKVLPDIQLPCLESIEFDT
jgi:hypothetical protein